MSEAEKGQPGKPGEPGDSEQGGAGGAGGVGGEGVEGQKGGVGGEGGEGGQPGGVGGRGGEGGHPGGEGGVGGVGGGSGVVALVNRRKTVLVYAAMMLALGVVLFLFNQRLNNHASKIAKNQANIAVNALRIEREKAVRELTRAADEKLCAEQHTTATIFRLFLLSGSTPKLKPKQAHIARLIDLSDCLSRKLPTVKGKP